MDKKTIKDMKIKRVPVADQVYDAIKEFISTEQWKIGEKIPSEKELAEMFGVNRLTVRIALQKLNALGIVETRVGEGTFVLSFNFRKYINEVSEFTLQPEQESDIMDFRKLFEIECARKAIEKGTPEELETLRKLGENCSNIYYRMTQTYRDGSVEKEVYNEYIKADFDFHYQVCKMSHNSLYVNCFNVASNSIYQYILMVFEENYSDWIINGSNAKNELKEEHNHVRLYEAIRDKDFETCRKYYLHMIDRNESID